MPGWGANAAMMWPVVPPLHAAGFAVLLIDARCHGRSGDETFTSMPRFAEDIAAGLAWLRLQPDLAVDRIAPLGTLARVRCPVLLVHGRSDSAVPVDDAQRLLAVSSRARLLLVEGDHDLREALAPHAPTLVDCLTTACALPAVDGPDGMD
jgi:pimeloyl-ACP methyl ester carboxylesterase